MLNQNKNKTNPNGLGLRGSGKKRIWYSLSTYCMPCPVQSSLISLAALQGGVIIPPSREKPAAWRG